MASKGRAASGTAKAASGPGSAAAGPAAAVRDAQADALRALFYAVQMMSEDAARRRFADLTAKEYLLRDEADECQMLADRLKVRLAWAHYDLIAGEWRKGRG